MGLQALDWALKYLNKFSKEIDKLIKDYERQIYRNTHKSEFILVHHLNYFKIL